MKIPKKLAHIWIGPLEPPKDWMQTWIDQHLDWDYELYGNDYLKSTSFETQAQIDEYWKRGSYAGVADLMRYEILYKYGGLMPEADSLCLHNMNELFCDDKELYTVYENEFVRGELVSPILASSKNNPFLRLLIDELKTIEPTRLIEPWKQTGNLFVAQMIRKHEPDITVWPSHYLIPQHYEGIVYDGVDKVYAQQFFASTKGKYQKKAWTVRLGKKRKKVYGEKALKEAYKLFEPILIKNKG